RGVIIAGMVTAIIAACALILVALIRSRRRGTTPEPVATPRELEAMPIEVPPDRPTEALGQRASSEDELGSITGIGPEMSKRLRSVGITSVGQIAAWSPEDIREIAEGIELDAERIEREDWVGQAQAAVGAT
ncbi:MAG: helix-hairpin-helix domain-containing protein, partial [Chloroflexota bacterium]